MMDYTDPEGLRLPPTTGHQDLSAWRFRDKWRSDDTSTVLAWANDHHCVFHAEWCSHVPRSAEPAAKSRVNLVREVFAREHGQGTFRYFGFCGHCLTERIANYGWEPSNHDLAQLETMLLLLNDIRVLEDRPTTVKELATKMKRYKSGAISPLALRRLIEYYKNTRGDEEYDLSAFIVF